MTSSSSGPGQRPDRRVVPRSQRARRGGPRAPPRRAAACAPRSSLGPASSTTCTPTTTRSSTWPRRLPTSSCAHTASSTHTRAPRGADGVDLRRWHRHHGPRRHGQDAGLDGPLQRAGQRQRSGGSTARRTASSTCCSAHVTLMYQPPMSVEDLHEGAGRVRRGGPLGVPLREAAPRDDQRVPRPALHPPEDQGAPTRSTAPCAATRTTWPAWQSVRSSCARSTTGTSVSAARVAHALWRDLAQHGGVMISDAEVARIEVDGVRGRRRGACQRRGRRSPPAGP